MTEPEPAYTTISSLWGTPDPRDAAAYPAVPGTPMTRWSWEFLRRRVDYRQQWQDLVQPFIKDDQFDLAVVYRDNLATVLLEASHGRVAPWEALLADFKVYSHPSPSDESAPHNRTLDPRRELPPWFKGLGVITVEFLTRALPESKVSILYDLDLPLDRQLQDAEIALRLKVEARGIEPPAVFRMQVKKFPLYLRLLDFWEAGTPNKEIRDHLFPKLRNTSDEVLHISINQSHEYARRWQRDYWHIALRSPT